MMANHKHVRFEWEGLNRGEFNLLRENGSRVTRRSRVLISGKFHHHSVMITRSAFSSRASNSLVDRLVDEVWFRQKGLAEASGVALWDTDALRLDKLYTLKGDLCLETSPIRYRVHSAMKHLYSNPVILDENLDRMLTATFLIETSDAKYVMAKVQKVSECESVTLLGGSCTRERMPVNEGGIDVFHYAQGRVAELLSLGTCEITCGPLLGLVQNEIGCVHLLFKVSICIPRSEVLRRFRSSNCIDCLKFVSKPNMKDYLTRQRSYISTIAQLL